MSPQIEKAHANPCRLDKYPAKVGPRKAPNENADVNSPETNPNVCKFSGKPRFLKMNLAFNF